eukprot:m.80587 g.80587  ORF g.80587 m.80587 type:complete len:330 (-) comp14667_c0_seq6:356-1345(-)
MPTTQLSRRHPSLCPHSDVCALVSCRLCLGVVALSRRCLLVAHGKPTARCQRQHDPCGKNTAKGRVLSGRWRFDARHGWVVCSASSLSFYLCHHHYPTALSSLSPVPLNKARVLPLRSLLRCQWPRRIGNGLANPQRLDVPDCLCVGQRTHVRRYHHLAQHDCLSLSRSAWVVFAAFSCDAAGFYVALVPGRGAAERPVFRRHVLTLLVELALCASTVLPGLDLDVPYEDRSVGQAAAGCRPRAPYEVRGRVVAEVWCPGTGAIHCARWRPTRLSLAGGLASSTQQHQPSVGRDQRPVFLCMHAACGGGLPTRPTPAGLYDACFARSAS